MRPRSSVLALLALLPALLLAQVRAQQNASGSPDAKANAKVAGSPDDTPQADLVDASWTRLTNGLTGTKNTDTRLAAIVGLSLLGGQPRAEKLIEDAMHDADIDVRLAAIVAAGEMSQSGIPNGAPRSDFSTRLRDMLNDPDPKVAFTAASTLWKLNDPSGEDILMAVAEGERSGNYSFWKDSKHNANRTLHNPAALTKIAVQQSMVILVPPVGIGMGAYGYLKGTAGVSPQITSIMQIAREHTDPVKHALIEATQTSDAGARVAAAEALAKYRGDDVRTALRDLLTDSKDNVRFIANAAYIRVASSGAEPIPTKSPAKRKK